MHILPDADAVCGRYRLHKAELLEARALRHLREPLSGSHLADEPSGHASAEMLTGSASLGSATKSIIDVVTSRGDTTADGLMLRGSPLHLERRAEVLLEALSSLALADRAAALEQMRHAIRSIDEVCTSRGTPRTTRRRSALL